MPFFTSNQYTTVSYEYYGARDALGRCTIAVACVGRDIMPTSDRGSISVVRPTGWHDSAIYERAHLIAHCLTGEDANWENLISGTYDLNGEMVRYENMVADYIKETGNHVLYRVTPIFEGNNLLASGVLMEAYSVEDSGAGICFCIFIHNVEGDYDIDYATGDYELSDDSALKDATYVVNKNKYKIHKSDCSSVTDMSDANKIYYYGTYDEVVADLIGKGKNYSNCGSCHPENG
ncbi:MAG: DNA/RNA non-specific endonuclease [Clostridia bacterium]|nr:DNA/RNA non-specific endonuclease [Clostridia bacterium]